MLGSWVPHAVVATKCYRTAEARRPYPGEFHGVTVVQMNRNLCVMHCNKCLLQKASDAQSQSRPDYEELTFEKYG